jgi:hypothetical protein
MPCNSSAHSRHSAVQQATLLHPGRISIGCGCAHRCVDNLAQSGASRVFLVSDPRLADRAGTLGEKLANAGLTATIRWAAPAK